MDTYLTYRQLRDKLNEVTEDQILDEPVLFTTLDGYGNISAYPVELLTESRHPEDTTFALCVTDEESLDMELVYNLAPEDYDDQGLRLLRQLPPGGLKLHFDETNEYMDECIEWLAQPNPHTPPAAPGPAPLFDQPTL